MPRGGIEERIAINGRMMQVVRKNKVSQAELVDATGATSPTVSDWYNKQAVPQADKLARVARALRVNGHWLLTGEGPEHAPGQGNTRPDRAMQMGYEEAVRRIESALVDIKKELGVS